MISLVKSNMEDARVLVQKSEVAQMPKWEKALSYTKLSNR